MKWVVFLKSRLSHRGGLEKYTRYLADAFAKKGCRVTILTTGICPSWAQSWDNVEVISLAPSSKFSLFHMRKFDTLCNKWLATHHPEVIFGMERTSYQTHYRAGSGVHAVYLKRRCLTDSWLKRLSFKLNPLHRYLLKIEKKAFENRDLKLLFTNSNMVREEILANYTTPAEKIVVVHNGVEWQEKEKPFLATFQQEREQKPYHFLFVGNGFKRKGLLFLLKGLSKLQEPYLLTVVGKERDLPFFKREARGLNVVFVGPQEDVTPFYQASDALVIPSIYDPFSNVTLEALAMGLFVVSSKFNGGHEILKPECGIVIKDLHDMHTELEEALNYPKTFERALLIRQSIKELDFSSQLDKIVSKTL